MNVTTIAKTAKASMAHLKFAMNKNAPTIMVVVGIGVIIGGTVAACVATRKLDEIMDEHDLMRSDLDADFDASLAAMEEAKDSEEEQDEDDIPVTILSVPQYKRECAKINIHTAWNVTRNYIPAALLVTFGICLVANGHRILLKRNAELLVAYSALEDAFGRYRKGVRERYGDEVDDAIYNGRVLTTETTTEVDADGKKTKVKTTTETTGQGADPYSFLFDELNSTEWTRSADYNLNTLKCVQNMMNDTLKARHFDGRHKRGFLLLNEVLVALGMTETPTGAVCGWLMPEDGEIPEGDDFVDFGLSAKYGEGTVRFLNGDEPSVWLHFNCQGMIYDKI